jgi:hypothetical protein
MNPTGGKLDEEQDIHDAAPQRVGGEEVAGHNRLRLGAQELPPAGTVSAQGWPDARPSQDVATRGGGKLAAELEELASNPHVSPPRGLIGQANHEILEFGRSRRPSRACSPPSSGLCRHKLAMPSHEGVGSHQEGPPAPAGKQAAQGRQQHPVLCAKARPALLSVQDLELVTEDDDLDILVVNSPHCVGEQSEQRATDQISERDQLATSRLMGENREPT